MVPCKSCKSSLPVNVPLVPALKLGNQQLNPPDPIPISALNQYAYCPRRCYLIHAEGEFADNLHTVQGELEHERVDKQESESQPGVRVEYALPVWSDALGLNGRCDAVEFHPDGTIYPVEHKHGKRRAWFNDELQLAAQALCLEEMFQSSPTAGCFIAKGAIFHQQSKRRREVLFDDALRAAVRTAVAEIRQLLAGGRCPPPLAERKRCGECSLHDICQPELLGDRQKAMEAMAAGLFEPEAEDSADDTQGKPP